MKNERILLVPDCGALRRKFESPPPLLAGLYQRFQKRLGYDDLFRRDHIFLPALLGEPAAVVEAKEQILTLAHNPLILAANQSPASTVSAQTSLDAHVWCVAPRAMRLAVYFTWLDAQNAWTQAERRSVGAAVLDFFSHYVVPVLRARVPAGHNQQFSMTFCSAVAGRAFAGVEGVAGQARALRDWALPKLRQTLGVMPSSGYSGEGSTYQSDVVSPLAMWAGIFLEQLGDRNAWQRRRKPNNTRLADTLKMEAAMGSCGGLLPPWDQYGWSRVHNLAARTLHARLSGEHQLLAAASTAWDEESFIAWRPDDRLWTLLYWPEQENSTLAGRRAKKAALSGWSLPAVGGAVEHLLRKLRAMMAWDRCAGNPQSVGRAQVNPNHLMLEMNGEPLTADGLANVGTILVSEASFEKTMAAFTPIEREMLSQQYGDSKKWLMSSQNGLLGMACSIVPDGWESYFPRDDREGALLFERRTLDRHTFTGEAAAYYQPAFDITRMRRTVSMGASGVIWVIDDIRASTEHSFAWRLWLRRGARLIGSSCLRLDLPSGQSLTMAWADAGKATLTAVPGFPRSHGSMYAWPDKGCMRCDRTLSGRTARFVTCLAPVRLDALEVRTIGPHAWEAAWPGGGRDRFDLPPEIEAAKDPDPVIGKQTKEKSELCDLDEAPFGLSDEPDAALLAALDRPAPAEWRRTGAAMQTLVERGNRAALPLIAELLADPAQNYTVHSVAAWCLGRAKHRESLPALRRMMHIPEVNTAARARWAVERIAGEKSKCPDPENPS